MFSCFFFSSRRRPTTANGGAGVQSCALPIFGIGRRRVDTGKDLKANLDIVVGAVRVMLLSPKDLSRIGIARRLGPMGHMHLHHRYGEIGAQHLLSAQRVRCHIGPRTDVLAVEVQQRVGRL